ncbi:hypothetical protein [Pseudotabrizicola formosa]|uniref:hypothetical protein n=1 Tax=Pseudotabrizicola formosa TaxID=2030009 RepID=UPI000CD1FCF7|nr:hypothetical protein [Pseudotabrizicola formosa]
MKKFLAALFLVASTAVGSAATVNVDLSGAVSGTLITAPGASFAGTFDGQTIVGTTGISGTPTGPLSLVASNFLTVAAFNPGVSPASRSILPQPNNQGPLSILLDSIASSITFTAGSADGGSISIAFFAANGALLDSFTQALGSGYAIYTLAAASPFAGLTIFNNTDPAGLRFQNFSYETGPAAVVPLPAGGLLLVTGVGMLLAARRRRGTAA